MSKWIQKGDKIVVTSGNHRGQQGEVLRRLEDRVVIQGVNVRKKHVKKTKSSPGQMLSIEKSVHISNVSLCNAEGKPIRLKARVVDGVKQLYYKDGQEEVVHRQLGKHS
jgi:large subunit ribosomal protein L24